MEVGRDECESPPVRHCDGGLGREKCCRAGANDIDAMKARMEDTKVRPSSFAHISLKDIRHDDVGEEAGK